MVVSNKEASILKANDISTKLLDIIVKDSVEFCDDDPAENAYLFVHSVGSLIYKISIILERYSLIYGIDKMNKEQIHSWINMISTEYLMQHKEEMND